MLALQHQACRRFCTHVAGAGPPTSPGTIHVSAPPPPLGDEGRASGAWPHFTIIWGPIIIWTSGPSSPLDSDRESGVPVPHGESRPPHEVRAPRGSWASALRVCSPRVSLFLRPPGGVWVPHGDLSWRKEVPFRPRVQAGLPRPEPGAEAWEDGAPGSLPGQRHVVVSTTLEREALVSDLSRFHRCLWVAYSTDNKVAVKIDTDLGLRTFNVGQEARRSPKQPAGARQSHRQPEVSSHPEGRTVLHWSSAQAPSH